MRRFFKYLIRTLAAGAGLLAVALAVLFIPGVQKFLLTRALSGPDTEVTVDEVRLRPGSAVVAGFEMTTPETRLRFGDLDSRFRLVPLLFRRTIDVEFLTITGLMIETEDPEEPEEIDWWEVFDGVLHQPPVDFHVKSTDIDGVFRSPAAPAVTFAVRGRDLHSRTDGGRIDIELEAADDNLPGNGRWFAGIEVRPEFDREGIFQRLCTDLTLTESPGPNPLLLSELCATRTESGEDYRIDVFSPRGPDSGRAVLSGRGQWGREGGEAGGTVELDLNRARLPLVHVDDQVPEFWVYGYTQFAVSEQGELHLKNETGGSLFDTAARFGVPEELDELRVESSFDIGLSPGRLSVNSLDMGVAAMNGTDLIRIHTPAPLAFEFGGDAWALPDGTDPLLLVDIPGIPSELVDLFIEDFRFTSEPVTAAFALHAKGDRIELGTSRPLAIRDLALAGPEGTLLEATNISLSPSGVVFASGFEFHLDGEASAPHLQFLALEIESAGALPLADTTSVLRLRAEGLPVEGPFADALLNGTFRTSHENENVMPSRVDLEGNAEATPRPGTSPLLPRRVAWDGRITQNSEGYPYKLNVFLPGGRDSEAPPAVAVEGRAEADGSRTEGTLGFNLPAWWSESLADEDGMLTALHGSGQVAYQGELSPLDLRLEATAELGMDTGRLEFPGEGRFSMVTEAALRLDEHWELESFQTAVSPEGGEVLARAGLLQPIGFREGEPVFDLLPRGRLLEIEFGDLVLDRWIPEAQRGVFSGGRVRGGFDLYLESNDMQLRPKGGAVTISGIHPGRFEGRELPAVNLSLVPGLVINEESVSFSLEEIAFGTDEATLLDASLSGGFPWNGGQEAPGPMTGTFRLNGDLASVEQVLGEGFFPRLAEGAFEVDADFGFDPEDARASWDGTFVLPGLKARDPEAVFKATAAFSGQSAGGRSESRLAVEIDDGDGSVQDLNLAVTLGASATGEGELPSLELRGSSEFLDLVRLGDLGRVFERGPVTDPPPADEPETPLTELLPVALDAAFDFSRIRVMPQFDLSSVSLRLEGNEETIGLREARARLPDNAEISAAATLSAGENGLRFASSGSGRAIVLEDLIRRTQGIAEPDFEGTFAFDYDLSARGAGPEALLRELDGTLDVTGERGRIRLTIPDGRMERIRRILNMQEGAIGSAVARLAGAPPGVQALADSINLLTNIPYESLDVALVITEEGRTLEVERLEFVGPYLYADGIGRLEDLDLDALDDTRLTLEVNLGTRRALREQFEILDLLSPNRNHLGYQMLRRRPVAVTGTLGEPDLRDVWNLLIQAGTGAATAGDSPGREERPPSPLDALRDVLGF